MFLLLAEYSCIDESAAIKAKNLLKSSCEWQIQHFCGVLTYSMMESSSSLTDFVFCELYQTPSAFWDHAKDEHVAKNLAAMFQDDIRKSASTKCLSFGKLDEGIASTMKALNFQVLNPLCGFLDHPYKNSTDRNNNIVRKLAGEPSLESDFAFVELKGIGSFAQVFQAIEKVINLYANEKMYASSIHTIACFSSSVKGKEDDLIVVLLTEKGYLMTILKAMFCTKEMRVMSIQERFMKTNIGNEHIKELKDFKFDVCSLSQFAGYGRHPILVGNGSKSVVNTPTEVRNNNSTTATTSVFSIVRNKFTDIAEAFEFSKVVPANDASRPKSDNVLTLSLLHVVRKFVSGGHMDLKLSCTRCFGILERLRKLRDDVKRYNYLITNSSSSSTSSTRSSSLRLDIGGLSLNASNQIFLEKFLAQINLFGYGLKVATSRVEIPSLEEFIQAIETEFKPIIEQTLEGLKNDRSIPYLGLQEYYRIGMFVKTKASSLGGVECGFRISDMYFEPLKSLFGGERFSFHLHLESILYVGGIYKYIFVNFEEVIGDWKEMKAVSSLDYVPITNEHDISAFSKRGRLIQTLSDEPSYKNYAERSFFPARIGGFSNSAASRTTASGRMMIDVARGIDAGCTPGGGSGDTVATAINSTMKSYRGVLRTVSENESEDSQKEKLLLGGLTSIAQIPDDCLIISWPGLVGFSFDAKMWGTVISDGLSDVEFDESAFEQLVLDPNIKELLLALLLPKHSDSSSKGTLEQFKGILGNHSSNGLVFLLHGAPGTGKSLTVQALAELMHVPLYIVSFGELGSTVTDLENRIGEIISLCERWKALILLDEGDALLEKRQTSQYLLNAMTGVLLRALDTFPGHMFITSNRVNAFDEAVLSRLTLAIQYKPLDKSSRQAIWANVLKRIGCDVTKFNMSNLAAYELSGREVNAAVKLALALAQHRGMSRLDQATLISALQVSTNFRREFGLSDPPKSPKSSSLFKR